MAQLRGVLFSLIAVLCGLAAFLLGWRIPAYLFNSPAEPYKDSLLLRGYAFETDIAKGHIDPLAISSDKTAFLSSTEHVIQLKLKGLSRQKYRLQLDREAKGPKQETRGKILQLLAELEFADSIEQKKELQRQIAALGATPGESLRYGIFLYRLDITENRSLE